MSTAKMSAQRNLNPHAEARLAMVIWSSDYCKQRGGVMDFWDTLSAGQKRQTRELLDKLLLLPREAAHGG